MIAKLRKPNDSPMCTDFSKWCFSFNSKTEMAKWTGKQWISMFMVFLDDQYVIERKKNVSRRNKKDSKANA